MGGEVIVKHLSGNTYVLQLTYYRDASPGTAYLGPTQNYDYYPAGANGLPDTSLRVADVLTYRSGLSTPLLANSPYNIEIGVYTDTLQLAPNQYWITIINSARNNAIVNMATPGAQSLGLVTRFNASPGGASNSSPRFLTNPVPIFFVNAPVNYNPLPYDPDGDSLVWSLNTPKGDVNWIPGTPNFGSGVPGFVTPSGHPGNPFTMNPISGNISWTPNMTGNFVQSFQVDEYRNGLKIGSVVRDYQYIVVAGDTAAIPNLQRSANIQYDAANRYHYLYYTAGQPISFSVTGTVGTFLDALTLDAYSPLFEGPNPPQFTLSGSGNTTLTGLFQWTPPMGFNRSVPVVVRQQNGYVFNDFTVVLKPNPNPVGVSTVAPALEARLYPNPASGRFQVELQLPAATHLKAMVVNPIGQQVLELHNGRAQGQLTLTNTTALSQGLYFVRLQTASGTTTVLPLTIQ
jgi:hypothetical protein